MVTYTFSRALRMMRYAGARMKSSRTTYRIINDVIYELNENFACKWIICLHIYADEIMGNWIEDNEDLS